MDIAVAWVRVAVTLAILSIIDPLAAEDPKPDQSLLAYGVTPDVVRLLTGRQIHMVCIGHGSPAVIFSAGMGDWSGSWNKVQPIIAKHYRTCAWDRAGSGFSGPSDKPQTVDQTTSDLEQALKVAGVRPPYVMVGHSMGAYESLIYADRHPHDVAGMVLVDPAYPDQAAVNARIAPHYAASQDEWVRGGGIALQRCADNLRRGTLKPVGPDPDSCFAPPPEYPQPLKDRLSMMLRDPAEFSTAASLWTNFDKSTRLSVNSERNYGNMPLRVLTATAPLAIPEGATDAIKAEIRASQEEWERQHDRLAALSTRGKNQRVEGSDHAIQQSQPVAVIRAISEVIEAGQKRP
jgi:pimeloyl-ACP methyl ester carboxylesterase